MSIYSAIKRIFGFGSDQDEDLNDLAEIEAPAASILSATPTLPQNNQEQNQNCEMIFSTVVTIFNNSLPGFLRESVDAEKQKKLLYEALEQDVKDYIAVIEEKARRKGESAWQAERDKLINEAENLRKKAESLEEKKSQIKEKQLSADRQKRALADRVRDLETQVLKLEAEKEQLDLENKSMVNKAKAASVLENELKELRSMSDSEVGNEVLANANKEIEELKQQLIESAEENKKLKDGIEALNVKIEMNDAMASDFKKKAATSAQEIKELTAVTESKEKELLQKNARIADLENKIQELEARCEDSVDKAEIEEIQSQLVLFEDVKKKMDDHITKLKASLAAAQLENGSLRQTIMDNLTHHAQLQKNLQERIDQLEQQIPSLSAQGETAQTQASKKQYPTGVEELISGADWLVSVPKEESPMRSVQESEDFGYNPPAKRHKSPENEAQMSLFDF